MNELEQAAELIENGWCTGQLLKGDGKYCSVGAILKVNGMSEYALRLRSQSISEDALYQIANDLEATKALAAEIREKTEGFAQGEDVYTVYNWNDAQTDQNEVLEMFKHAAKRLNAAGVATS